MRNLILLAVAAALAAVVALFLLRDTGAAPMMPAATPSTPTAVADASTLRVNSPLDIPAERTTVEEPAAPAPVADVPAPHLAVTGRVVDEHGSPVPNAQVAIWARIDPQGMMANGPPRNMRNMWQTMRGHRELGQATVTDEQGRFRLQGDAYEQSRLEVGVVHPEFAPLVVNRSWRQEEGDVQLEDIVVHAGGKVLGIVVDDSGRPIPGAKVHLEIGGGGFGRFGRGGRDASLLESLLAPTETDSDGRFAIAPLPTDSFTLLGEADGLLPGSSDRLRAQPGETLPEQTLTLAHGTALHGVVRDADGNPIADAKVAVSLAPSGWRQAMQQGGGGGRRGWQQQIAVMAAADAETQTAADGTFGFAAVPTATLRLVVTHPDFCETSRDDVDAQATPMVELVMQPRLALQGMVVDADTGAPIEQFGIVERRVDDGGWGPGGFGRRGGPRPPDNGSPPDRGNRGNGPGGGRGRRGGNQGNQGNQNPTDPQAAEREARRAERESEQRSVEAELEARLGPSREPPQELPPATEHPGGAFEVSGLEPGHYVFDLAAPGYVAIAAGPIDVSLDQQPPSPTFALARGRQLGGVVTERGSGDPVVGAHVQLVIPTGSDNGPRIPFLPPRPPGMVLDEVTTAADGTFVFPPQRAGTFTLRLQADGYVDVEQANVLLPADSDRTDLRLDMQPGAKVWGHVVGLPTGERAEVVFAHQSGPQQSAYVDPETQTYEIAGLAPGAYAVFVEREQDSEGPDWRRRISRTLALNTGQAPDLVLAAGQVVRFDPSSSGDLARITGQVMLNGEPGRGLEVALEAVDDGQNGEDPRAARMLQRFQRSRVDNDGAFSIEDVVPGQYLLHVSRRGRQSVDLWKRELALVRGDVIEQQIDLRTGNLVLHVSDGNSAPIDGWLILASPAEVGSTDPGSWRDQPSTVQHRVRNGEVTVEDLPLAGYRYAVGGNGFTTATGDVTVMSGNTPLDLHLLPSNGK